MKQYRQVPNRAMESAMDTSDKTKGHKRTVISGYHQQKLKHYYKTRKRLCRSDGICGFSCTTKYQFSRFFTVLSHYYAMFRQILLLWFSYLETGMYGDVRCLFLYSCCLLLCPMYLHVLMVHIMGKSIWN